MTGNHRRNLPIVLTTDFGSSDAYVGVMKGVILGINPDATIVDLTHEIGPQNVRQGAFVLGVNRSYFPPGTIHVAVVDPGVGTDRKPIVLETPTAKFIAPDNGLLSEVVREYLDDDSLKFQRDGAIPLPALLKCRELSNPLYQRHPVSSTFHGRDIFAPAAAHLSLGVRPEEFGPAVSAITYSPTKEPIEAGNVVVGEVIYTDHFGNLITNISRDRLDGPGVDRSAVVVEIGSRRILGLSRAFHNLAPESGGQADGLSLVALVGSNGYLEVAVRDGNAADSLGFGVGEEVRVIVET
jgi:S-adenosylmethionine hydrolase